MYQLPLSLLQHLLLLVERLRPSKPNGRVTTPTVNAPISLAILATTGAAPVPVPPPYQQ